MNNISLHNIANTKREAVLTKWKSKKINKIIDKLDLAICRTANRGRYCIRMVVKVPDVCREDAIKCIEDVYKNRGFVVACTPKILHPLPGSRIRCEHPTKIRIYISWRNE